MLIILSASTARILLDRFAANSRLLRFRLLKRMCLQQSLEDYNRIKGFDGIASKEDTNWLLAAS